MSYSQVISLDAAKTYLRIDSTDSDSEILRMVKSALSLLEKRTNVMVYDREVTYNLNSGNCVRVYDHPINTVGVTGLAPTVTRTDYPTYSVFVDSNTDNSTIVLDVGYVDSGNMAPELLEAAYEMIDYWFYKNDGKANITLVPESVMHVIGSNQRFII